MSHNYDLDVPQLVMSTVDMASKTQAKFYCPPELWDEAKRVMDAAGFKYSEGVSRMLALLVMLPDEKRADLFKVSPAKAMELINRLGRAPADKSKEKPGRYRPGTGTKGA